MAPSPVPRDLARSSSVRADGRGAGAQGQAVVGRAEADGRGGTEQTRRADECDWEWRMTGGAQLSVEKMEAQFIQPAGVEAHIWVSKI